MNVAFLLKEAFQGLWRNITMTVAMVITIAISIGLVTSGVLMTSMTERTKDIYLDRVEVMVELSPEVSASDSDCSSAECREVMDTLNDQDGIDSVTFRSRAQTYDRFVELFEKTDPLMVEQATEENMLAAVLVRLEDPLDTEPLDPVRDLPQVNAVIDQVDDLRGATDNLDALRNATFVFAGLMALAAVLLVANMVQIAAFSRRDEMQIMRMVGATRLFTQAPFVIEAIVAALIGSALALGGLFAGKKYVLDPALDSLYKSRLLAPVENADIWLVSPAIVLAAVLIAAVTAQLTLRLYVRK